MKWEQDPSEPGAWDLTGPDNGTVRACIVRDNGRLVGFVGGIEHDHAPDTPAGMMRLQLALAEEVRQAALSALDAQLGVTA